MHSHSLVLSIIGLAAILATLGSLRREHIRVEYSISWLAVGVVLTVLSLFPGMLESVARKVDLDPAIFFLLAAGALLCGLVFEISHVVSKLRDENVILTQRLAFLEYQIRQTTDRHGQNGA
jgi:hypothetical protein